MGENKLFDKMYEAVDKLRICYAAFEDDEIPPIARSEIYNETWLLRLTLALIHDYEGRFEIAGSNDDSQKEEKEKALDAIRTAVKKRWISEGGLSPVFENEGTTWADAILGDVTRRSKTKRGVEALPEGSIVIVEAKMGSALANGTDNIPGYDQAARNIGCLAQMVALRKLSVKCGFFVFAPDPTNAQTKIENAFETFKRVREAGHKYKMLDGKELDLLGKIDKIAKQSIAMSWDEVIGAINNKDATEKLLPFYKETCKEFRITPDS